MSLKFKKQVPKKILETLRKEDWYRHGIYDDSIIANSFFYQFTGKKYFAQEGLRASFDYMVNFCYDGRMECYITNREMKEISEKMLVKIQNEPSYLKKYIAAYRRDNQMVLRVAQGISKIKFQGLSNQKIAGLFRKFCEANKPLGHWIWSMEFLNAAVDIALQQELKRQWPRWSNEKRQKFITRLAYLEKFLPFQEEQKIILEFGPKILKDKKTLTKIFQKYRWLNMYIWSGRPFSEAEYLERVKKILEHAPELLIKERETKNNLAKNKKFFSNLKDRNFIGFIQSVQELIYLKTERIDVLTGSWFMVLPLVDEICQRLKINYSELLVNSVPEILNGLKTGKIEKNKIVRRKKNSQVMVEGKLFYFYDSATTSLRKALTKPLVKRATEIAGVSAYPGVVRGRAKVLFSSQDLNKLVKGDILVVNLTNPNYNPAFNLVSGIITDEGGVLCHSAIMAREFKLPCIINTKIATSFLRDGDTVELDANNGTVRLIKRSLG